MSLLPDMGPKYNYIPFNIKTKINSLSLSLSLKSPGFKSLALPVALCCFSFFFMKIYFSYVPFPLSTNLCSYTLKCNLIT